MIEFCGRQIKHARRFSLILLSLLRRKGGFLSTVRRVIGVYRRDGLAGLGRRLYVTAAGSSSIRLEDGSTVNGNDYAEWVRRYDTLDEAARAQIRSRIDIMPRRPKISVIVAVNDAQFEFLDQAIGSIRNQLYPEWELCIAADTAKNQTVRTLLSRHVDKDARIRVVYHAESAPLSYASNSVLALVTGEFVALLDGNDLLSEHALFCVAVAVLANPDVGIIYSDEDKISMSGIRVEPYFKCDWNPDLFLSHNMITHLGVYRTELVRRLGGFREAYDGGQDYDLALRCVERTASEQIIHIPRVLYHCRMLPTSVAFSGNQHSTALLAGERALNDYLTYTGVSAKAELLDSGRYRVRYALPVSQPLVSLIIPTKNGLALTRQCIDSILVKTLYANFEILLVDNGSDEPAVLQYFASLANNPKIRILRDAQPFNYSALNNAAVKAARGEYIALLNNDIEVISPDWLGEMLSIAAQPGVGAIGARLWYPNDTLQHGGIILGLTGAAGHAHRYLPRGVGGYAGRAGLIQTLSAVTAACLLIKKSIYDEVGGLEEANLKVAFNDVDLCLKVRQAGYRNVWTPYAELYHYESATRGLDDTLAKQARAAREVQYMKQRWGDLMSNDPAYSPNLTLNYEDFSFAWPPRVARINAQLPLHIALCCQAD